MVGVSKKHLDGYKQTFLDLGFEKVDVVDYSLKDILPHRIKYSLVKKYNQVLQKEYDVVYCISAGFVVYTLLCNDELNIKCKKLILESGPPFKIRKNMYDMLHKISKHNTITSSLIANGIHCLAAMYKYHKHAKVIIESNNTFLILGSNDVIYQLNNVLKHYKIKYHVVVKNGHHVRLLKDHSNDMRHVIEMISKI